MKRKLNCDPLENMGAQMVKEVALNNDLAGDADNYCTVFAKPCRRFKKRCCWSKSNGFKRELTKQHVADLSQASESGRSDSDKIKQIGSISQK
jgi:hypothetical protein